MRSKIGLIRGLGVEFDDAIGFILVARPCLGLSEMVGWILKWMWEPLKL
jgi:hypothetical protein